MSAILTLHWMGYKDTPTGMGHKNTPTGMSYEDTPTGMGYKDTPTGMGNPFESHLCTEMGYKGIPI